MLLAGRRSLCASGRRRTLPRLRAAVHCASARASAPDVIVVGGGAAGLTAAYFCASAGAQVTVLERMRAAGKKIVVSGGQRCNVLPEAVDLQADFFTESRPGALRALFASWSLEDCRRWLEQDLGLRLALEPETRKWFPASNSSHDVRDALLAAAERRGARVLYGASVEALTPLPAGGWACVLADGTERRAHRVVLAAGGSSFPKMGTDGAGFRMLRELGHALRPPYPALTPLTGPHPASSQLAGLAAYDAQLESAQPAAAAAAGGGGGGRRRARRAPRRSLLFTHRGYSGPGVLDLSHTVTMAQDRGTAAPGAAPRPGPHPVPAQLRVSWTPDGAAAWDARLCAPAGGEGVAARLRRGGLPARLADALCAEAGLAAGARMAELRREQRGALVRALTAYALPVTGHEGYAKAEVTGGGLPLEEVDCATLESRLRPGLFVCGELIDLTGRIGGFNFYIAWLSGRLAGLSAARA